MLERVREDYGDPADYLPYDSAEGGYQAASVYTSWELITEQLPLELAPRQNDQILDALHDRWPAEDWCHRDPLSLSDFEVLHFSWEAFCRLVKQRARYFFLSVRRPRALVRDELMAPSALLRNVASLAAETGLLRKFEPGLVLYRARWQKPGSRLRTALDLGPPRGEQAVRANRMNPPGIPVFYASRDAATALAESWDGPGTYVVGRFVTRRPLVLLDLSAGPMRHDYFSLDSSRLQHARFLERFSEAIAEPVARDDRNHIDYVPTQVVAEYFRTMYRRRRRRVGGILWRSAVRPGRQSCALFASQADLVLSPELVRLLPEEEAELRGVGEGWLELTGHRVYRLRRTTQASGDRRGRARGRGDVY